MFTVRRSTTSARSAGDGSVAFPQRLLGDNDDDDSFESLLVDGNGESYDPYSLAWRYLGMYIDCDVDNYEYEQSGSGDNNRDRRLSGNSNDDGQCSRKLLWAAYVDRRYRGNQIGEYKFYELGYRGDGFGGGGSYSSDTCASTAFTSRCVKMDCHEPSSHFRLVGVYKETDGLYDWSEQLFKHEGYCVWNDEDVYDVMESQMESWPSECTQLNLQDSNGNDMYYAVKPLQHGNITVGVYYDENCLYENPSMTYPQYIEYYYSYYAYYYGYNNDQGSEAAASWEQAIESWNEYMTVFKLCQPCRSYNLDPYGNDNSGSNDRDRHLGDNNGNDGEGDAEINGYDCYDDAGYTNVDQCYKFEAKTSMELATSDDMRLASSQGTILAIRYNGRRYGSGSFRSTKWWSLPNLSESNASDAVAFFIGGVCAITILVTMYLVWYWKRMERSKKKKKKKTPNSNNNVKGESDHDDQDDDPELEKGGDDISSAIFYLVNAMKRRVPRGFHPRRRRRMHFKNDDRTENALPAVSKEAGDNMPIVFTGEEGDESDNKQGYHEMADGANNSTGIGDNGGGYVFMTDKPREGGNNELISSPPTILQQQKQGHAPPPPADLLSDVEYQHMSDEPSNINGVESGYNLMVDHPQDKTHPTTKAVDESARGKQGNDTIADHHGSGFNRFNFFNFGLPGINSTPTSTDLPPPPPPHAADAEPASTKSPSAPGTSGSTSKDADTKDDMNGSDGKQGKLQDATSEEPSTTDPLKKASQHSFLQFVMASIDPSPTDPTPGATEPAIVTANPEDHPSTKASATQIFTHDGAEVPASKGKTSDGTTTKATSTEEVPINALVQESDPKSDIAGGKSKPETRTNKSTSKDRLQEASQLGFMNFVLAAIDPSPTAAAAPPPEAEPTSEAESPVEAKTTEELSTILVPIQRTSNIQSTDRTSDEISRSDPGTSNSNQVSDHKDEITERSEESVEVLFNTGGEPTTVLPDKGKTDSKGTAGSKEACEESTKVSEKDAPTPASSAKPKSAVKKFVKLSKLK